VLSWAEQEEQKKKERRKKKERKKKEKQIIHHQLGLQSRRAEWCGVDRRPDAESG